MSVLQLVPTPNSTMPAPLPEPTAEAVHLRHFIEKQPFSLMRVGIDGRLIAASDAALELLSAGELDQALGSVFTTWIVPAHHDHWREFAARVCSGTQASFECELTDPSGLHRTILLHGVPFLDHPDGIASMIVGAQDVSSLRRLETALQEGEARRQQLMAGQAVEWAQLQETLEERHQLERLLKQGRNHLRDLRTQLEQAVAERHRLETVLQEREISHQQLVTEHTAEGQRQLDQLRAQLEQAVAERHRLETLLESLAHQILQANPEASARPDSPNVPDAGVDPSRSSGRLA